MNMMNAIQGSDTLPQTQAPTLASSAMLVEVNISHWVGRKKDKRASADVTSQNYASKGVANVNKKLLANNDDLKAQYFKYSQVMSDMQDEFWRLVQEFLHKYNDAVIDVQIILGDLFSRDDYPDRVQVERKFSVGINYMPLPDSGDFRVDIGNDALAEVQEKYSEFYAKQYNAAMDDVWTRLHKSLTSMSERLDYGSKEDKKVFRDSLVGNVNDMIELLRVCNVTGSTQMSAMANSLEEAMSGVTPDALREDDYFRAETKAAVDAAIKSLPSLDI